MIKESEEKSKKQQEEFPSVGNKLTEGGRVDRGFLGKKFAHRIMVRCALMSCMTVVDLTVNITFLQGKTHLHQMMMVWEGGECHHGNYCQYYKTC